MKDNVRDALENTLGDTFITRWEMRWKTLQENR